jgi:hypothetical protein
MSKSVAFIYTSSVTLPRPTSLPGNSISTLLFSCGSTSLPRNSISTLLFSCGPTSLCGNSISTLLFCCGPTSLPGNSISTLLFFCGPTSLRRCTSTVQWSSFEFLESSSLRKVVEEEIPPAATKTSTYFMCFLYDGL